jgi:hypothetical protein
MCCVRFDRLKPDKIIFHTVSDINSPYWDKAKKYVTIDRYTAFGLPLFSYSSHHLPLPSPPRSIQSPPQRTTAGVPLKLAAHQSDILRLTYLIEKGGIYMDWDVVSLAPVDELLNSPIVFGAEKKIVDYREVLGVAWIAARPGTRWMKLYLEQMQKEFTNDCYSCHSTILGRRWALEDASSIRVLNYTSFYHPGIGS